MRGSAALLTRAFRGLVDNALRFSNGSAPNLHITFEQTDQGPVFGVKDQGIGIDARFTEVIFAPYRRLPSPVQHDGTGMGLSVVGKIVYRHGGRIWVDSVLGAGSHFRFTLPRARLETAVPHPSADDPSTLSP